MEALSQTRQEYNSQRDVCAAQLQQLHDEQAEYEAEQAQMRPPSTIDYGALQVKVAAVSCAQTKPTNTAAIPYD